MTNEVDLSKCDNYQAVYFKGEKIREGARTDARFSKIKWSEFVGKDVLDLGCSNGMLSIQAKKMGARKVLGVDKSTCVQGAMEVAKAEGLDIDFRQVDIESKEFQDSCPNFDITFFCAMLNHMKDKRKMLEFIDLHTRSILYYETNFQNKVEPHLEYLRKYTSFCDFDVLGESEIYPESYHLIKCVHDTLNYTKEIEHLPIVNIPINKLTIAAKLNEMSKEKFVTESLKVEALIENIRLNGLRHPLLVSPEGDFFIVQEGGHRLLAVEKLGWKTVPCRIVPKDFRIKIRNGERLESILSPFL